MRFSKHYILSLLLFCVFSVLVACGHSSANVVVHFENPDGSSSPKITSELATTPGTRKLGLMYRKEMPEEEGMFFVFPAENTRSFWMKNTYLELDIIYLSANQEVVSIVPRAVPHSETPRPSVQPAKYVLEVNGGLAKKWGVVPGSKLIADRPLPAPSN